MPKPKRFLLAGWTLTILAVIFVVYALNNPQGSFPWGGGVTGCVYLGYGMLTGWMFVRSRRAK